MSRHDRPYTAILTCGQTGKRGYHCEHCDLWHLGHLPWAVKRGQATARDHYDKKAT